MAANQPPWPREWLMTDERMGDRLWEAVQRLPTGAGIIFRHYHLDDAERLELGLKLAERASDRKLVLGAAGSRQFAERIGASLVHNPGGPGDLAWSMAVHDQSEALAAKGAALAFVAPVFPTRSHPARAALGIERAAELAAIVDCPAIALGGMDESRFRNLCGRGFHGYAGIDCWLRI